MKFDLGVTSYYPGRKAVRLYVVAKKTFYFFAVYLKWRRFGWLTGPLFSSVQGPCFHIVRVVR